MLKAALFVITLVVLTVSVPPAAADGPVGGLVSDLAGSAPVVLADCALTQEGTVTTLAKNIKDKCVKE